MSIKFIDNCDLPHNSLIDDVLHIVNESKIRAVKHEGGWCTWSELLSVPGILDKRDYYDHGWLSTFVVYGDDWVLQFDRSLHEKGYDEYYNKWIFASIKKSTDKHVIPELGQIIQDDS